MPNSSSSNVTNENAANSGSMTATPMDDFMKMAMCANPECPNKDRSDKFNQLVREHDDLKENYTELKNGKNKAINVNYYNGEIHSYVLDRLVKFISQVLILIIFIEYISNITFELDLSHLLILGISILLNLLIVFSARKLIKLALKSKKIISAIKYLTDNEDEHDS